MTDQLRKDIAAARKKGFIPGKDFYWRGATLMVEILPGEYVNEDKARSLGVIPVRDPQFARAEG